MNTHSAQVARLQRDTTLFAPSGMRLDETDHAILRLLQTDARITVQAIAEEIELSHSGALHRVKRLEESGTILRHVAEIDETVFEVWPMLFVEIVLTTAGRLAREELDAAIAAAPEIIEAVEMIGKCDLLLKVALPAPVYWASLQKRLDPTAALIDKARPRLVGRTIKRMGVHPLLQLDRE
jgi:DNA-binding Lrp family transcriptional regulator